MAKFRFRTTRVLVLGAIVGPIWAETCEEDDETGFEVCGVPLSEPLPKAPTFADGLRAILKRRGGDFRIPRFSEDTIVHVERERVIGRQRRINVRQIPIAKVPGLEGLVEPDTIAADYH